jgi:hypothetical protein
MSKQAIINYCLNRSCPAIMLLFIIFANFKLTQWEPYVIIGLIMFIDRFQFKVGYSVGYCEARGIDPLKAHTPSRRKNIPESEEEVDDR